MQPCVPPVLLYMLANHVFMGGKKKVLLTGNLLSLTFSSTFRILHHWYFCHWRSYVSHPYTYHTFFLENCVFNADEESVLPSYSLHTRLALSVHSSICCSNLYCQQITNQYEKLIQLYVKLRYEYRRLSIMHSLNKFH